MFTTFWKPHVRFENSFFSFCIFSNTMETDEAVLPEKKLQDTLDLINKEIESRIEHFDNNDFVNQSRNFPKVKSFSDLQKEREKIIEEYKNFKPIFNPDFFANKMEEIQIPEIKNINDFLIKYFQKKSDELVRKKRIVCSRLSKIIEEANPETKDYNIKQYVDMLETFVKENSKMIYNYQTSIIRDSANLSSKYFEEYKNDILNCINDYMIDERLKFPISTLLDMFKYYPVYNRNRILNVFTNKIHSNLVESKIPSLPKTPNEIIDDIKKLAAACGIAFDIESYSGQEFIYQCEKIFSHIVSTQFPIEYFNISNDDYQDLFKNEEKIEIKIDNIDDISNQYNTKFRDITEIDLINDSIIKSTKIDNGLLELLKLLMLSDLNEVSKVYQEEIFKYKLESNTDQELLVILMKLRFIANKKLLLQIYNNSKKLIALKSKLLNTRYTDEEIKEYFKNNLQFIFTYASILIYKHDGEIYRDSIIELILSLENQYEQNKEKIINAFLAILDNNTKMIAINSSSDDSLKDLFHQKIIELIDKKPYLIFDNFKSLDKQFELNVLELECIRNVLWTLINIQIKFEHFVNSPVKYHDTYLFSEESIPHSIFEVFPRLKSILKFYEIAPKIAEEMCLTLSISYTHYGHYMRYSVWSLLQDDIQNFFLHYPLPFEMSSFSSLQNDISPLFQARIFNDFSYIQNYVIELSKQNSREILFTFLTNLLQYQRYFKKLRRNYIIQHYLIAAYNQQTINIPDSHADIPKYNIPNIDFEFFLNPDLYFENHLQIDNIKEEFKHKLATNPSKYLNDLYRNQMKFTKLIEIIVRFNGFQCDALFVRSQFSFSNIITDFSLIPYDEAITKYLKEFSAKILFPQNNDFQNDKPLFTLSNELPYEYYLYLYEIGILTQTENFFFKFNPMKKYFKFDHYYTFYDKTHKTIDPFVIPFLSQSFALYDSSNQNIDFVKSVHSFLAYRIQICHLARFESVVSNIANTMNANSAQIFLSVLTEKLNWDGQILDHFHDTLLKNNNFDPFSSFENFRNFLFYKFNLGMLLVILNSNDNEISNNDENRLIINFIKIFWSEVHHSLSQNQPSILNYFLNSKVNFISKYMYIPKWIDMFMYYVPKTAKKQLFLQLHFLDSDLSDKLIQHPETHYFDIARHEYTNMIKQILSNFMKEKASVSSINIENAVHNASQSSLFSNSLDNLAAIETLIMKKQIKELNNFKEIIDNYFTSSGVTISVLKPAFYSNNQTVIKPQLFCPTSQESEHQINIEIKYRFLKVVQKLREISRSPNFSSEQLSRLCSQAHNWISINTSFGVNYPSDIDRLCKIYASYLRNIITENSENNEPIAYLSQYRKYIEDDSFSQFNIMISDKLYDKILELNDLNGDLFQENEKHKTENQIIKSDIRKEFEDLLVDIDTNVVKERQRYKNVHDKLYGQVKDMIIGKIPDSNQLNNIIKPCVADINETIKSSDKFQSNTSNELYQNSSNIILDPNINSSNNSFDLKSNDSENGSNHFDNEDKNDFNEDNLNQSNTNNNAPFHTKENEEQSKETIADDNTSTDNSEEMLERKHGAHTGQNYNKSKREPLVKFHQSIMTMKSHINENITNDSNELHDDAPNSDSYNDYNDNDLSDSDSIISDNIPFSPTKLRRGTPINRSRPPSSSVLVNAEGFRPFPSEDSLEIIGITSIPTPPPSKKSNRTNPLKRRNTHQSIIASYIKPARVTRVKDEINNMKDDLTKIRIVHVLKNIALKKQFDNKLSIARQDNKIYDVMLWNSKKSFDENVRSVSKMIKEAYNELAQHQAEIESIQKKLEKRKQETIQLAHWKEMNLRLSDSIQTKLKDYSTSGDANIDVFALIRKIEEAKIELENLRNENEEFDREFDYEVREPMETLDYYKRQINRVKIENAEMTLKNNETNNTLNNNSNAHYLKQVKQLMESNEELRKENEEILLKIQELEAQKQNLKPEVIGSIEQLTAEPQLTVTQSKKPVHLLKSKKIVKPQQSPRKAKSAFKSLKKGFAES